MTGSFWPGLSDHKRKQCSDETPTSPMRLNGGFWEVWMTPLGRDATDNSSDSSPKSRRRRSDARKLPLADESFRP